MSIFITALHYNLRPFFHLKTFSIFTIVFMIYIASIRMIKVNSLPSDILEAIVILPENLNGSIASILFTIAFCLPFLIITSMIFQQFFNGSGYFLWIRLARIQYWFISFLLAIAIVIVCYLVLFYCLAALSFMFISPSNIEFFTIQTSIIKQFFLLWASLLLLCFFNIMLIILLKQMEISLAISLTILSSSLLLAHQFTVPTAFPFAYGFISSIIPSSSISIYAIASVICITTLLYLQFNKQFEQLIFTKGGL
jgi:hypothetical protein